MSVQFFMQQAERLSQRVLRIPHDRLDDFLDRIIGIVPVRVHYAHLPPFQQKTALLPSISVRQRDYDMLNVLLKAVMTHHFFKRSHQPPPALKSGKEKLPA